MSETPKTPQGRSLDEIRRYDALPYSRHSLLGQRIQLMAQRLVFAEGPDLQVIMNHYLMTQNELGSGSKAVKDRHERRLRTVRELLTERIRLEKEYPFIPRDFDCMDLNLIDTIEEIISNQKSRIVSELQADAQRILDRSCPQEFMEAVEKQFHFLHVEYHREADICLFEWEHRQRLPSHSMTPAQNITLNISNSQITGLNVGGTVGSIQATVNSLQTAGADKLAEALKALAEAIPRADALPDDAKRESLELVSVMGDELAGQRRHVILRSIGETLKGLLIHAGEAYGAYETLKVAVKLTTGYDLP